MRGRSTRWAPVDNDCVAIVVPTFHKACGLCYTSAVAVSSLCREKRLLVGALFACLKYETHWSHGDEACAVGTVE